MVGNKGTTPTTGQPPNCYLFVPRHPNQFRL